MLNLMDKYSIEATNVLITLPRKLQYVARTHYPDNLVTAVDWRRSLNDFWWIYLYVLNKKLSGAELAYECAKRRSYGNRAGQCHGRLRAGDGNVTKVIREHTHAPEPGRVDALKAAVRIKQKAMDTQNTAQQIITEEL